MVKARMDYVDMARGVAIIMVMIGHSVLFPACGAIHIPTFFVLTGFLVTLDGVGQYSLRECLKKRALRLLYPYAFYSCALLGVRCLKDLCSRSFSVEETLKHIFGILYSSTNVFHGEERKFLCFRVGNEGLWFLTAMVCACVAFYCGIYYLKNRGFSYLRLGVIGAGLILSSMLLCRLPVYLPWGLDIGLLGAVFMLYGFVLRRCRLFENQRRTIFVVLLAAVLFLLCHWYNGQANMAIHLYGKNLGVFLLSGAFGSVVLIGLCRLAEQIELLNRMLSYVGKNTLFLLAFHTMVFGVIDHILEKLGLTYEWTWIPRLFLTLGICLFAQWCLEKLFRIPRKLL